MELAVTWRDRLFYCLSKGFLHDRKHFSTLLFSEMPLFLEGTQRRVQKVQVIEFTPHLKTRH